MRFKFHQILTPFLKTRGRGAGWAEISTSLRSSLGGLCLCPFLYGLERLSFFHPDGCIGDDCLLISSGIRTKAFREPLLNKKGNRLLNAVLTLD